MASTRGSQSHRHSSRRRESEARVLQATRCSSRRFLALDRYRARTKRLLRMRGQDPGRGPGTACHPPQRRMARAWASTMVPPPRGERHLPIASRPRARSSVREADEVPSRSHSTCANFRVSRRRLGGSPRPRTHGTSMGRAARRDDAARPRSQRAVSGPSSPAGPRWLPLPREARAWRRSLTRLRARRAQSDPTASLSGRKDPNRLPLQDRCCTAAEPCAGQMGREYLIGELRQEEIGSAVGVLLSEERYERVLRPWSQSSEEDDQGCRGGPAHAGLAVNHHVSGVRVERSAER